MDSTVLHLRLDVTECETLDGLAGKALNRQAVARMLLIAAIEAVQRNGNMVHLPPKLRVFDETAQHFTLDELVNEFVRQGVDRTVLEEEIAKSKSTAAKANENRTEKKTHKEHAEAQRIALKASSGASDEDETKSPSIENVDNPFFYVKAGPRPKANRPKRGPSP